MAWWVLISVSPGARSWRARSVSRAARAALRLGPGRALGRDPAGREQVGGARRGPDQHVHPARGAVQLGPLPLPQARPAATSCASSASICGDPFLPVRGAGGRADVPGPAATCRPRSGPFRQRPSAATVVAAAAVVETDARRARRRWFRRGQAGRPGPGAAPRTGTAPAGWHAGRADQQFTVGGEQRPVRLDDRAEQARGQQRPFQPGPLPVVEVAGEVDAAPQRLTRAVPASSQGGSAGSGPARPPGPRVRPGVPSSRSRLRSSASSRRVRSAVNQAARAGRAAASATWSSPSSPDVPRAVVAGQRLGVPEQRTEPGARPNPVSPSSSRGLRVTAPGAPAPRPGRRPRCPGRRRGRPLFARPRRRRRRSWSASASTRSTCCSACCQPPGLIAGGVGPGPAVRRRSRPRPGQPCAASRSPGTTSARAAAGRVTGCGSPSRSMRSRAERAAAACSTVRISSGRPAGGQARRRQRVPARPTRAAAASLGRLPQLAQGPPGVVDRRAWWSRLPPGLGQRLVRRRAASAASVRSRWTRSSAVLKISRVSIACSAVVDLGPFLGQLLDLPPRAAPTPPPGQPAPQPAGAAASGLGHGRRRRPAVSRARVRSVSAAYRR